MTRKDQFLNNVKEFATISEEFCYFLENANQRSFKEFLSLAQKLTSLLYLKASLLPDISNINNEEIEKFVTEEAWTAIHDSVKKIMKNHNFYHLCDNPENDGQTLSIAEDMADIYQDIKDFTELYKTGVYDMIYDGTAECRNNFRHYWGLKALNALRAIHLILVSSSNSITGSIKDEFDNSSWIADDKADE